MILRQSVFRADGFATKKNKNIKNIQDIVSLMSLGAVSLSRLLGQLYLLIGCYILLMKCAARDIVAQTKF